MDIYQPDSPIKLVWTQQVGVHVVELFFRLLKEYIQVAGFEKSTHIGE